eukprot:206430_1
MKSVIRSIKNEINNYDEGERLVRELTSNEATPPSTQMLIKCKIMLTDQYQFPTVVRMLFRRLKDYNNIKHVEKSLICIEYLIKNADRKFVRFCQVEKKQISKLSRYRYILGSDTGSPVDYGGGIRKRAKRVCALLDNGDKLKASRAKAQGYAMQFKGGKGGKRSNPQKQKQPQNRRVQQQSHNAAARQHKSTQPRQKQAAQKRIHHPPQQKAKKKKKKVKKKKEEPEEPQFASLIDMPPEDDVPTAQGQGQEQAQDDLLSGDWWQKEEAGGAKDDEDEFGWFQGGDAAQETGVGDDGGAFGFGDADDFNDEMKDEDLNADMWMTHMTKMDNVLEGSVQKKDANKRKQGTSMAMMAKTTPSSQPIPNSFGTDDFFNENSNDKAKTTQNNNDFDPFGLGPSNDGGKGGATDITSLYGNNAKKPSGMNFGYQSKSATSPYNTDPFAGIGGGAAPPKPAKYVTRKKQNDPFAQFGMK